jgi:hypothetical protein
MKQFGSIAFMFCFLVNVYGQYQNDPKHIFALKLSSFDLSTGFQSLNWDVLSVNDFQFLFAENIPGLETLNQNNSNLEMSYPNNIPLANSTRFSIGAGVSYYLRRNDGTQGWGRPVLRFGLNYTNSKELFGFASQMSRHTYDTVFTSYQDQSNSIFIDSVYSRSFDYRQKSNSLILNLDILWRTYAVRKVSVCGGFGLGVGVSLQHRLSHTLYENHYKTPWFVNEHNYNELISGDKRGPIMFNLRLNSILGFEYFVFEEIGLFYEYSPTMMLTKVGDLNAKWNYGHTHAIGFRFHLSR